MSDQKKEPGWEDEERRSSSSEGPAFRFAQMIPSAPDEDAEMDTTRSASSVAKPFIADAQVLESEYDREIRLKRLEEQRRAISVPANPGPLPSEMMVDDVIDVEKYFRPHPGPGPKTPPKPASLWVPDRLRQLPAFYPLEKSTRLVEDETSGEVAARISERLRTLSIYAVYDNQNGTASLLTAENIEMHLSLWKTPSHSLRQGVLVELQRRKGDSIAFHRYSRTILDAAVEGGEFDISQPVDDIVYSKKVQLLLSMELSNHKNQEHENAIIAIEIAHGLLTKDRMDARQLGLESFCLLTDPSKTGYNTAVLTAHVVLLGSTRGVYIPGVTEADQGVTTHIMMEEAPFQQVRETILCLVQLSHIGEVEDDEEDRMQEGSIEKEQLTLFHNLALAVLANSLNVIENFELHDDKPEDTKPRHRLRTASSSDVAQEFMSQTKDLYQKEILSTLISELGTAKNKPHNAALSAKCIGSLCRASDEAKRRAKELGAKQVVTTALEVGERTHLKLEMECKEVVMALQAPSYED